MIQKPINTTLPATGGTAALISLGTGQDCSTYMIQASGDVDMLISDVEAMTTYFTVKAGTALSLDQVLTKGADCFYAISAGAEDTVELLLLRG
jgi:hypothetical protein